jgi:sugar phosphate isomerase/epimerase
VKIGFTTLGCPTWDVDTICRRGCEYGFDGVDFRGMQDGIDITVMPEFTTDLTVTKRRFADAGLAVSGISSSLKICDEDRLDDNLEEARRTLPLAHELEVTTIRVFGAGDSTRYSRAELADTGQRTMEAVFKLDGADDFKWVFETHDEWIAATDCTLLLDRIPDPAFGVLWDMGHTTRVGGESPEVSANALGDRIYCLHVKDAIYDTDHPQAMEDGWRYVAPGAGQLPLAEAMALLRRRGYDGWLIFEHEKRWHQDLPEPEEIFPQFIEWYRGV